VTEWLAWLITVVVFAALHLVNVLGGGNLSIVFIVVTGGTLLYVSRRVSGNLFVPIGLHAFYDTAFYLLTGKYAEGASLPGHVLDIQLASFLVLLVASILLLSLIKSYRVKCHKVVPVRSLASIISRQVDGVKGKANW